MKWNPNPLMAIESRPSALVSTGFSFWMVMAYKEHVFEEMLPHDFMAVDQRVAEEYAHIAREKLEARLRPILWAEDGPGLRLVSGSVNPSQDGLPVDAPDGLLPTPLSHASLDQLPGPADRKAPVA